MAQGTLDHFPVTKNGVPIHDKMGLTLWPNGAPEDDNDEGHYDFVDLHVDRSKGNILIEAFRRIGFEIRECEE